MTLIFILLLAAAVALLVFGVAAERGGAVAREMGERLRRMAPQGEDPVREVERDRRLSVIPWMDHALRNIRLGERLEMLLYQAGVGLRAGSLILLCVMFAVGGYIIGLAMFHRILPAVLGLAVCAPMPLLYVLQKKNQQY